MVYIPLENVPAETHLELEAWVRHLNDFEETVASRETAVSKREELVRRREEALMRIGKKRLGGGQPSVQLIVHKQQPPSRSEQLVMPTIVKRGTQAGARISRISKHLLSAGGETPNSGRHTDLQPSQSRGTPLRLHRQPSTHPRDLTPFPGRGEMVLKRAKSQKNADRPRRIAAYNLFKKVRLPAISAMGVPWREAMRVAASEWKAFSVEERQAQADRANFALSKRTSSAVGETFGMGGDEDGDEDDDEERVEE